MSNLCPSCKTRPKQTHKNAKWCLRCAMDRRRRPRGTLTSAQIRFAKSQVGQMSITKVAERLGVSVSNIKRSCPGVSFWFQNGKYKNRPELVRRVFRYYSEHGKLATVKAFPTVNVKCIVDRPAYYGVRMKPRQIRWKDEEIVLAAKMAGLVDGKTQARIFNRPGANEGSIRSLWVKKFRTGGGNIHGMSEWMAKHLLKPGYPVLKTRVWSKRKGQKDRGPVRGIVLWCDLEQYLLRGTADFIREGVKTMAQFQRWLFESKHPKREILKLMKVSQ